MKDRLLAHGGVRAGLVVLVMATGAAPDEAPPCARETGSPGELSVEPMPAEWGVRMPSIQFCTSDTDCAGCARCRRGLCSGPLGDKACMCHGECVDVGHESCDLSPQKPLCGGVCSDAPPRGPLPCGRGNDTVRLERFPGRECLVAGATVAPAGTVAIQTSATQPTPSSRDCSAGCARLEVVGPVIELLLPREGDGNRSAAITFAGGHWFAAWSRGQSNATLVQRFTADGEIDGRTLRIEGTAAPRSLLWSPHAGGQLMHFGYVQPSYTAAGAMLSLHRWDLDLKPSGEPLLLRGPGTLRGHEMLEANDRGEFLWTSMLDRPGGLVREILVPAGMPPGKRITPRDWRTGAAGRDALDGAFESIDGQGYLIEVSHGSLRIRALLDNGALGAPRAVFDVPAVEGRQLVLSERIGRRWYVSARAAARRGPVRIQAVDASSLVPVGSVIDLSWPEGRPYSLIDADGTPMLEGSLSPVGRPSRSSLVPLDPTARAACPASTVFVPSLPDTHQAIGAIHFNGNVAGVIVTTWDSTGGSTGAPRLFFTRIRCVGPGRRALD